MLAHRYVGLLLAGFLVLTGLTGAPLAFYPELDAYFASRLQRSEPPAPGAAPLDPLVLRERLLERMPHVDADYVELRQQPGRSAAFFVSARDGAAPLPYDEVYVDPYTGAERGRRLWGDPSGGLENLMPFVYRLHYSLAAGTVGTYVLGIVALLWTIDCFVGAWLTLPARGTAPVESSTTRRSRWSRWRDAWRIRWSANAFRVNYDVHRAGALWTWLVLFVFAWSSVAFNLREVYSPTMQALFGYRDVYATLPQTATRTPPVLGFGDALARGRELMRVQAAAHGFEVAHEEALSLDRARHVYRYTVRSSRDIRDRRGSTAVFYDASSGAFRALQLPTGDTAGNTLTTWLTSLHMAQVWGWPYRAFVSAFGLFVVVLSATGVVIWARKRGGRRGTRPAAEQRAGVTQDALGAPAE